MKILAEKNLSPTNDANRQIVSSTNSFIFFNMRDKDLSLWMNIRYSNTGTNLNNKFRGWNQADQICHRMDETICRLKYFFGYNRQNLVKLCDENYDEHMMMMIKYSWSIADMYVADQIYF